MRALLRALPSVALLAALAAQENGSTPPDAKDVLAAITRAEGMLKNKEVEEAILLLWQAIDQLDRLPANPVHEAARLSALYLLQTNDPLEGRRRAMLTNAAKGQVELAALYRGKKWFDAASDRIDVAARLDRDVVGKERALLDAARPKPKPGTATPPEPAKPKVDPLLDRAKARFVYGEWREVEGMLECDPGASNSEWVADAAHADHEVVVEFRPADPAKPHNLALAVGHELSPTSNSFGGYRAMVAWNPKLQQYWITLYRLRDHKNTDLAQSLVTPAPTQDGFRRLSIQVRGSRLRAQLDGTTPIETDAGEPVRGTVGLMMGLENNPTCPVRFRNLRIDPLPADAPTDDELRAERAAERQGAIAAAVDAAKAHIAKKELEPASLRLREALALVDALEAGVLRDNLAKTIEPMLAQADSFAAKRKKTDQTVAAEFVLLADAYAKNGMVRVAEVLAGTAVQFDRGQSARLDAAREAVQKWNVAQAAARAAELVPPTDDGTALREWFGKGRKLDTYTQAFEVDGAEARVRGLLPDSYVGWLPPPMAKPITKARVHAHLTMPGESGGLCFDVVDSTQFGTAFLTRRTKGMRLHVFRRVGTSWVLVLEREVPMDAWRRDAWHALSVESTEAGATVTCAGIEVKVPRASLGKATGVFGLYAANGRAEPQDVELRAFQVGP